MKRTKLPHRKVTRARAVVSQKNVRLLEGSALAVLLTVIGGAFLMSALQRAALLSGQHAAVVEAVLYGWEASSCLPTEGCQTSVTVSESKAILVTIPPEPVAEVVPI